MKKTICILAMAVIATAFLAGVGAAATSVFGTSGNILTPDATVIPFGSFSVNLDSIKLDDRVTTIGLSFGVEKGIEIGLSRFSSNAEGATADTVVNAKYQVLSEKVAMPSVVIGAVDATGTESTNRNGGCYIVLGKNLTSTASGVAGSPIGPLNATVGYGGGIYGNAYFAGLNWQMTDGIALIGEYVNKLRLQDAMVKDNVFNAGMRLSITKDLKADLNLIDMKNLGFGVSYSKAL